MTSGDDNFAVRDASYLFHCFENAHASAGNPLLGWTYLMRAIAAEISEHGNVPVQLESTFRQLEGAWATASSTEAELRDAKHLIWAEIRAKNNGSTLTIVDDVDRTMRAILCLVESADTTDAMDVVGWAAEMLSDDQWPRQTSYF